VKKDSILAATGHKDEAKEKNRTSSVGGKGRDVNRGFHFFGISSEGMKKKKN